jgi:hypothetical protein
LTCGTPRTAIRQQGVEVEFVKGERFDKKRNTTRPAAARVRLIQPER